MQALAFFDPEGADHVPELVPFFDNEFFGHRIPAA